MEGREKRDDANLCDWIICNLLRNRSNSSFLFDIFSLRAAASTWICDFRCSISSIWCLASFNRCCRTGSTGTDNACILRRRSSFSAPNASANWAPSCMISEERALLAFVSGRAVSSFGAVTTDDISICDASHNSFATLRSSCTQGCSEVYNLFEFNLMWSFDCAWLVNALIKDTRSLSVDVS